MEKGEQTRDGIGARRPALLICPLRAQVYCLTQFNSASLNRHLSQAYNANVGGYSSRGFVEVRAALPPAALDMRPHAIASCYSAGHVLYVPSSPSGVNMQFSTHS